MTHLLPMPQENLDRVLVGDCIELMQGMPAGSVDMVLWPENVINVPTFAGSAEFDAVAAEAKRVGAEERTLLAQREREETATKLGEQEKLTREAQEQVGFADRILMSKTDLVAEDDVKSLAERIRRMNPRAPVKKINFGEAPIEELLDLRGFNLNAILDLDPEFLAGEHPHSHDGDIAAFAFNSERPFDPARLDEFLGGIVQVYGPDLLRYKGVLYMHGTNRRVIFQGVHMLMGSDVGKAWEKGETRFSRIVFIGRNLPREVILKGLEQCLVQH